MDIGRTKNLIVAALLLATSLPAPASAQVAVPPPPPVAVDTASLDEATRRTLELENMVSDLKAEQVSIDNRLAVTEQKITDQSADLKVIKDNLRAAQDALNDRAVGMYKFTGLDELSILLDAPSFTELVSRASVLMRVLEVDRQSVEAASIVASQADYESGVLEELRTQDTELKTLKDQRVAQVKSALDEQGLLINTLSATSKKLIDSTRVSQAKTRAEWKAASIPLDEHPAKVKAVVLPYTDRTYWASEYHPRRYRTTGVTYSAVCSWYGPGFHGRNTASGQRFNQWDLTCASRNLPFGTWLALTKGNKRIIVVVNDRGPYVTGRDLDLSAGAARALGFWGVETIQVEVVKAVQ